MGSICANRVFVDGSCVLSIDDDQLAMRSKKMVDSLGLSYHVIPRKREGLIQVALCDSLFVFFLSSHYLCRGESSDKGLLAALMHLRGVQFPDFIKTKSNPADCLTKMTNSEVLRNILKSAKIEHSVDQWVERN